MSSTNALVCRPSAMKNRLSIEQVPIPSLKPHQVLLRNIAAAQNPTDIKSFDMNRFGDGAILGCDLCGRVEELGSDVTRFQKGDRVGGFVLGGRPKSLGAYSTHTVVEEAFCFKVPETVSSEAAATLPLALTTAWLALLSPYCLDMDRGLREKNQLLIWGGATSVGQYAIQFARHFGFQFAVTCTNAAAAKALGAEHVFNYRSPTVIEDIRKALPEITYVLDCVGSETSSAQASSAVHEAGGTLCTVALGKANTQNVESRVKVTSVVVFTAFFEEIHAGPLHLTKREEDRDLADELYKDLPEMLANGIIKPNPVRLIDGGLKGVEHGFQLFRDGAIKGEKVVYKIE